MPFVTDELWTALWAAGGSPGWAEPPRVGQQGRPPGADTAALTGEESVVVAPWPAFSFRDQEAETEIASVMRLVTEVRRFRSDQGLRPGQRVAARLAGIEGTPLARHENRIRSLLRLDPARDGFTASAALAAEGITVELDVAGAVDVAAERRRLEKDLAAARKEAGQASRKLDNAEFLAKAPDAVVAKTRQRLAAAEADIARLEHRLTAL
jgi:valyl-tRNA synthetase